MKKLALVAAILATISLTGCKEKEATPVAGGEAGLKNHVRYYYNDDLETLTACASLNGYYEDEGSGTKPINRIVLAEYKGMKVTHVCGHTMSLTPTPLLSICVYFESNGYYAGEYASLGSCSINTDAFDSVQAHVRYYSDWNGSAAA